MSVFQKEKNKKHHLFNPWQSFWEASSGHESETTTSLSDQRQWSTYTQIFEGQGSQLPILAPASTLPMWAANHPATCRGAGGWRLVDSKWHWNSLKFISLFIKLFQGNASVQLIAYAPNKLLKIVLPRSGVALVKRYIPRTSYPHHLLPRPWFFSNVTGELGRDQ